MRKNSQPIPTKADARKALLALRNHLERRTEKVENDLERREGDERDSAERAIARENDEVLSALSGEGRDQLALIDAALGRLDAGTYGICTSCGKKIAKARLDALPYAARCLGCAK